MPPSITVRPVTSEELEALKLNPPRTKGPERESTLRGVADKIGMELLTHGAAAIDITNAVNETSNAFYWATTWLLTIRGWLKRNGVEIRTLTSEDSNQSKVTILVEERKIE